MKGYDVSWDGHDVSLVERHRCSSTQVIAFLCRFGARARAWLFACLRICVSGRLGVCACVSRRSLRISVIAASDGEARTTKPTEI